MVLIQGNKRVADIYLGEYMRLWNHHAFREFLNRPNQGNTKPQPKHLRTDDWWSEYFKNNDKAARRKYFSGRG